MRQTVRKITKVELGLNVRAIRECKIDLVIILRGTDGEPKTRLAPSRARVTAREVVGRVHIMTGMKMRNSG